MTITVEEYKVVQDACGFKKGDIVKVTHKAKDNARGWNNTWAVEMDDYVGGTYHVHKVAGGSGVTLMHIIHRDKYNFPYYVLRREEKAEVEEEKVGIKIILSCGNVVEEVLFSKELLAEMKAGNKLILNTVDV